LITNPFSCVRYTGLVIEGFVKGDLFTNKNFLFDISSINWCPLVVAGIAGIESTIIKLSPAVIVPEPETYCSSVPK
jgi:hypothetical protein